jgi:acyl carrier protein
MTANTATTLLAEALQVEPGEIDSHCALGHTAAWDSLAHTRLILALEAQLARPLSAQEVVGLASFSDVAALLAG